MRDSNQLHAICMDTYPPIHYLNNISFSLIDFVTSFNKIGAGPSLAYTFDAGPNCFLLMEEKTLPIVTAVLKECFLKDPADIRFGSACENIDAVFLGRTYFCTTNLGIWYFFHQEIYIHFVAQESSIIRKLFIFYQKGRNRR